MKTHSEGYKNGISKLGRELDSKITFTLDNEVIELGKPELNSITPSYETTLLKSVMKYIEVDSNVEIPVGTIFKYELGLKVNGEYEYLNFGNYVVKDTEIQEDTNSYLIKAYDKMLYSMKDYEMMAIAYPITVRDYINAICTHLGLTFANASEEFVNYDKVINNELYLDNEGHSLGYTFRDVLDQMAEVTASNIIINTNDEIELKYITAEQPRPTRPSKNIVDTQGFQNGYINTSGVFVSDNKTALLNYKIPVEAGKTYCFSTNANVDNIVISMFGSSDNFLRRQKVTSTNKVTQLMASDVVYVRFAVNYNNSSTMTQEIIDNLEIMGEVGDARTIPYEPYGPVEMGKNLLDTSEYELGYYDENGEFVEDNTVASFSQYIPVTDLTYLNLSANATMSKLYFYIYDGNKEFIDYYDATNKKQKYLEIDEGEAYYRVGIKYNTSPITDQIIEDLELMVEDSTSRTSPYEPYIEPQEGADTIDESYLKNINVKFGKTFGPVNTIVLTRAGGSDSIYEEDAESVAQNGRCEIRISENQVMNFNDRDTYIPEILEQLDGLKFSICDFDSTGITYYDACDKYDVSIGDTTYECLMLNDSIEITQGLQESVYVEEPEDTNTDYTKSDKTDNKINQTYIIANKQEGKIEALTSRVEVTEDDLRNTYTKEQVNSLVQTAETGLTNTFSEAGGNNIFRNTGLFFENTGNDREDNPYEFWYGIVARTSESKASNQNALLLQDNTVYQEQVVPNGAYTISFKYKKLIELSVLSVSINDEVTVLDQVEDTEFIKTIEVTSQHINIGFTTDIDNGCEIYDLMVNAGGVKLAYSQNQNETTTDTVNISKGIEVTSSETNTKFRADSDGIRVINKNSDEVKTQFTDKGMETTEATITKRATITNTLFQEVGDHTWITRL